MKRKIVCMLLVILLSTFLLQGKQEYDEKQSVFCLAILSSLGPMMKIDGGTPCEVAVEMKKKVDEILSDDEMKKLVGSWEVAWGPGIFHASCSADIADNTIYVAKSTSADKPVQYVVSIAGTAGNFPVSYDWLVEDFFVSVAVPWPYAHPESLKPKLAHGTYIGLKNLQGIRTCDGLPPGYKATIYDFFKNEFTNRKDKAEIITAGHSLGGALSPVLALWLADTKECWDSNDKAVIKTYPSAGATPGDKDFANYYDSRLGQDTTRIWNDKDVVPHAWNRDSLLQVPCLYKPEIPRDPWVDIIAWLAIINTNGHNYTQIVKDAAPLHGKTRNKYKGKNPVCSFLEELKYQHGSAYFEMLKVDEFSKLITKFLKLPKETPCDELLEKLEEKLQNFRR